MVIISGFLKLIVAINFFNRFLGVNAECGGEFTNFLSCVSNFSLLDNNRYPWGVNFGKFYDLVADCFTDNGCGSIDLLRPEQVYENVGKYFINCDEKPRYRRHLSRRSILEPTGTIEKTFNLTYWPEKMVTVSDGSHFSICKRSLRREIGRELEQCAKKFLDGDFRVPEEKTEKVADAPMDRILIDEYYSVAVFNLTQDRNVCPLEEKMVQLRQCLGNVFNSVRDNPASNSFEKRAKNAKMAACKANCLSRLGPCKNKLVQVAQQLCECVPDSKISQYHDMLRDCYPDLNGSHALEAMVLRDLNVVRSQICILDTNHPCA